MGTFPRTFISTALASFTAVFPMIVLGIASRDGIMITGMIAAITWIVNAAHVLVLGLPAFFVLRHLGRANRRNLLASGFVLGCSPIAVMIHRDIAQGGSALLLPLVFGVLGALSAWVYWVAWCRLGPSQSVGSMSRQSGAMDEAQFRQ